MKRKLREEVDDQGQRKKTRIIYFPVSAVSEWNFVELKQRYESIIETQSGHALFLGKMKTDGGFPQVGFMHKHGKIQMTPLTLHHSVMHNELPSAECHLRKYCDQKNCVSHYWCLKRKWTSVVDMDVDDVLAAIHYLTNNSKDDGNCRIWTGAVNPEGYGIANFNGHKGMSAHGFSCQLFYGEETPSGMVVRHLCGHSLCINPHHLQFGTHQENTIDRLVHRQYRPENKENMDWKSYMEQAHAKYNQEHKQCKYVPKPRSAYSDSEFKLHMAKTLQLIKNACTIIKDDDGKEHWLHKRPQKNGYAPSMRWLDGVKMTHTVAWMCYYAQDVDQNLQIRHKHASMKNCVNPACLIPGTGEENARDKVLHGTLLQGESHPNSSITDIIAEQIKKKAKDKEGFMKEQYCLAFLISSLPILIADIHGNGFNL